MDMQTDIIGVFKEEGLLINALKKMKEENVEISEVFSPYPIHEVFKIMNRKTRLQVATFFFAAFGLVLSYFLIYWTSVISYPLNYGGKPFHAIPSFIIICFVTTICVAIVLSVFTFFIRSKLYPGKKPLVIDRRITDDAFVILISPKTKISTGEIDNINDLLKVYGATEIILSNPAEFAGK